MVETGPGWELRLGRWQDALSGVRCSSLIFDAPYSAATHAAVTTRNDNSAPDGLTPDYAAFTDDDVRRFCNSWRDRCDGWMVSLTDSRLAPVWGAEMEAIGRYAFAPVPCVIRGMSVRIQGDGPSSWAIWAVVSRPRNSEFVKWGTLPGAYTGPSQPGAGGGRGKPRWLLEALVRDYTRPGDLICDPFAGWGSTICAAVALGRRGIGAEMDAAAFAEAAARVSRPTQIDMFGGAA